MSESEPSQPLQDTEIQQSGCPVTALSSISSLKRRASSFEGQGEDVSRKRMKEEMHIDRDIGDQNQDVATTNTSIVDDLAQELQCGCCAELVYRPVIVAPCQHFFCGSCCALWIRNGGTNCPACRGVSTIVTPFRALDGVIEMLLRHAPHKARAERERQQADEVYKAGQIMRIPLPREASPEPNININTDFVRPCPHCAPGNAFGWTCPRPIPDPATDVENAWHVDDGVPPDHAHCGNCENLLATNAPSTTKCDLCHVSFCGIGVQNRCIAAPLTLQHLNGMSDVGDMIQSSDVYECFDSNFVEVEYLLDFIRTQRLTPRHIYREIVAFIQASPRGFAPLIELDLFNEVEADIPSESASNPEALRNRICRTCATEVFLWGLRDWWVRERQKGAVPEHVMNRPDCPDRSNCVRQKDQVHAKEYNHIFPSVNSEQKNDSEGQNAATAPTQSQQQQPHATRPGLGATNHASILHIDFVPPPHVASHYDPLMN